MAGTSFTDGRIVLKTSANPAAGGEIVYVADEDMIIYSVLFQLATSAAGGARTIKLAADDGTSVFWHQPFNATQPISVTYTYTFSEGGLFTDIFGTRTAPLPSQGLRLLKNWRLRTITGAMDAGDDFTAMTLQVERPNIGPY